MNLVCRIDPQKQAGTKKGNQSGCLQLVVRVLDEQADLLRRLAATPSNHAQAAVTKIGRVELSNPVIAQARAFLDRSRPGLVPDHAKRELELASLGGIAVIGESHLSLFMLVIYHIQWYKSLYHLYMVNQSKIA